MARPVDVPRRFRVAYLSLAALFGAAVGSFVVVEERPAPKPPPPWSTWQPTASGIGARQEQIAAHVGAGYHLASGKRLVDVFAGGPPPASDPIQEVAVAKTLTPQQKSDVIGIFSTVKTAMFVLCGDGPKCAIKEGKPSNGRGAVVGRESLELALYTFRYIKDADAVITFVPPAKGKSMSRAFLFTKAELANELKTPLRRTLPQTKPPLPGRLTSQERGIVDRLTASRVFRFRFTHGQSGERVLVLAP
jgi:hypothetical protein